MLDSNFYRGCRSLWLDMILCNYHCIDSGFGILHFMLTMRACQVYAVTVYVEGEKAARELGVRHRGGFFDDNRYVHAANHLHNRTRHCRLSFSMLPAVDQQMIAVQG